MNSPTFSICIPNYNYANYIGQTIQSVLLQTCQDFEIIVADNASTDASVEVVKSFHDERIRLIQNRYNIGFAPNLQRASETARGQYMLLLSSDDRMLPNALDTYWKVLVDLGDAAQHSILFAEALKINGYGEVFSAPVLQPTYYQELQCTIHKLPNGCYYLYEGKDVLREVTRRLCAAGPFLSMLYSRSLYEAVQGYNSVHLTDPDTHFAHKLLSLEPRVAWLRDSLFEYRVHESNQYSLQKKHTSIKKPIDKYLLTLETSDATLKSLELKRQELVRAFIYRYCVNEGIEYLTHGAYAQAWKGLMFGFTTYPSTVLRTPRAYGLAALLATGFLATPIARLIRDVFRRLGVQDE